MRGSAVLSDTARSRKATTMKLRIGVATGLFSACLFAGTAALANDVTLPGPLVTSQWLQSHVRDVQVVDIRDDPLDDDVGIAVLRLGEELGQRLRLENLNR